MQINEYEPNARSLLVATPNGLEWLHCPFMVRVLDSIKHKISEPVANVDAVYSSQDGKLVYLIKGQLFYYYHFDLDLGEYIIHSFY